jgi:hypothetical protein
MSQNQNGNIASITVHSDAVTEKNGEKNGKPWSIREQDATIETPDRRQPVRLSLGKGQAPYAPGRYTLDLVRNLNVSEFGSIQLKRSLELQQVKA